MKAQTNRKLQDGTPYDAFITPAAKRDRLIAKEAGVPDTLQLVARVATTYRAEVGKLADKLRVGSAGSVDVAATCRALWNFVYGHIQYHLDEPGLEQVRHPARSWADRVRGVDCEDYSVFISAVLQNLGIRHLLRISAYKNGWQHIYVIVPKDPASAAALPQEPFNEDYTKANPDTARLLRRDYFTLDCVTDSFDNEVAPSKTMNLVMPQLLQLSGLGLLPTAAPYSAEYPDTLMVASYPSESGHTIGIGDLGGVFVLDQGDLGDIDGLGSIGGFKPFKNLKKLASKLSPVAAVASAMKGKAVSRKVKKGGLITKLTGAGGKFRNPAEVKGAKNIAAAWLTKSRHFVGVDSLGTLYVMDHNDQLDVLAGLAGIDVNDPELAGFLKKAFKKVSKVAKAVAKPIGKAGKFVGKNAVSLAKNYGADILQAAGGLALTAVTGGGAAPLLLAAKAAKGVSIASKVAKVAKVAKTAQKAAKVISLAKKAQKAVQVAQTVSRLLPRKAVVPPAAVPLSDNEQDLDFTPYDPNQVQDFMPNPVQLVQRVDEAEEADDQAAPTVAFSTDTQDESAYQYGAALATSSVTDPYEQTYAVEETAEEAPEYMQQRDYPQGLMVQEEEMGALGALGLSSPTVLVVGGTVLALGIAAIYHATKSTARTYGRAAGLSGTPRRRKATTKRRSTAAKGKVRTLKL